MKLSINVSSILIAAAVGTGVGAMGGPVFVLLPWAAIGLALGWFCASTKAVMVNGAVYGFLLSFVFMLAGYTGADPVSSKLAGFAALGLFGAICGLILTLVSYFARTRLMKKRVLPRTKAANS